MLGQSPSPWNRFVGMADALRSTGVLDGQPDGREELNIPKFRFIMVYKTLESHGSEAMIFG